MSLFKGIMDPKWNVFEQRHYLEVLGKASKFILRTEHWNHNRTPLEGLPFSNHPNIQTIVSGFMSINEQDMMRNDEAIKKLKAIVRFSKGLSNSRCHLRVRKKRLSRLAKATRKAIKLLPNTSRKSTQGISYYSFNLKALFLHK